MPKPLLLSCIFLFAAALTTSAQDRNRETKIDKHFAVADGGLIDVKVVDADVDVTNGPSKDVHVRVVLEGVASSRADEYFEKQNFTVTQDGNTVRVTSKPDRNTSWNWREHPHIRVEIAAPEVFDADIQSADGDLSLEDLTGNVSLRTADGDVTTGALEGSRIEIQSADGDVRTGTLRAETIRIRTSDGDLDLADLTAKSIEASTADGDVSANAVSGAAEVKTSDGSVVIASFEGPALEARTSDGSIRVDRLATDRCRARTSDGDIVLKNAAGDVEASTVSGDVHLEMTRPGTIEAATVDGNVVIMLPSGHRADLSLRGENVSVSPAGDFDGRIDEERADGTLNGGGAPISASTMDGRVSVQVR